MAIVTFPSSLGGDNSQVSDDSSPTTGLANGGHRTRFVAALIQLVAIAQNVVTNATTASAAAVTAVNAPATNGSSATSLTVAVGAQAFTTQTGKAWVVGQPVAIARTSAPAATLMNGTITAYNSGTGAMTVQVVKATGSGTFSDWTISLTGAVPNVDAENAAMAASAQLFGGM